MADRYHSAICRRGHIVELVVDSRSYPQQSVPRKCNECGASVLLSCPTCKSPILGGNRHGFPSFTPDNFCGQCGEPYPWADRTAIVYQLENLLEEDNSLDAKARLELHEQILALTAADSTEKSQVIAGNRIKALVPRTFVKVAPILQAVVTAEVLRQLGLR